MFHRDLSQAEQQAIADEIKQNRNKNKAEYRKYREVAMSKSQLIHALTNMEVRVSSVANVLLSDEGAFVDATIFVPKVEVEIESSQS